MHPLVPADPLLMQILVHDFRRHHSYVCLLNHKQRIKNCWRSGLSHFRSTATETAGNYGFRRIRDSLSTHAVALFRQYFGARCWAILVRCFDKVVLLQKSVRLVCTNVYWFCDVNLTKATQVHCFLGKTLCTPSFSLSDDPSISSCNAIMVWTFARASLVRQFTFQRVWMLVSTSASQRESHPPVLARMIGVSSLYKMGISAVSSKRCPGFNRHAEDRWQWNSVERALDLLIFLILWSV